VLLAYRDKKVVGVFVRFRAPFKQSYYIINEKEDILRNLGLYFHEVFYYTFLGQKNNE
jgi:hypothetical protein